MKISGSTRDLDVRRVGDVGGQRARGSAEGVAVVLGSLVALAHDINDAKKAHRLLTRA